MKYVALLFVFTSCVQKFSSNDLIPQHLPKEVPEMVLTMYRDQKPDTNKLYEYITPRFFISKHEITNRQFCYFLNEDSIRNNKELIKGLVDLTHKENKICLTSDGIYVPVKGYVNYPVVLVSWWGAKFYCEWLSAFVNKKRKQNGMHQLPLYRLPSEFEWVSATAENRTSQWSYNIERICDSTETGSSVLYGRDVKKDTLNIMGIAGMNENIYEWTNDDFYAHAIIMDFSLSPTYYEEKDSVVVRIHGLMHDQQEAATCGRVGRSRDGFYSDTGFRIVQTYLGRSSGMEF